MVALAVAAGVVYLQGREGDDAAERRAAVRSYIARVNMTQQELAVELVSVNEAYGTLKLQPATLPAQIERLDEAEATLAALTARVRALRPPADAATLHRELVALLGLQVEFAAEVTALARYLLVEVSVQRKLAVHTRRLSAALTESETAAGQGAALDRYARALSSVVTALEGATAPPVVEPSRIRELARAKRLVALSGKLGASLTGGEAQQVDRLFRSFAQATADTGTTRAERGAVIAFNRRSRVIADKRAAVNRERARLDRAVR